MSTDKIRGAVAYALGYSPDHEGKMVVPANRKRGPHYDQERAELACIGGIVLRILNEQAKDGAA